VTQGFPDVTPGGNDLSDAEAKVWRAVQSGELVDLRSGDQEMDRPERGAEWDAGRTVRAEVLSRLLVGGADVPTAAPKGVRLRGARISGQLDLGMATVRCPLALFDCLIDEVAILDEVNAPAVRLGGSHLPGLQARQLVIRGDLGLDLGFTATDEVRLFGAKIGGQLSCRGGTFTNDSGPALSADGLTVDGDMFCDDGFAARGEVRLSGAKIGGLLSCSGGTFTNEGGRALVADGLTVDADMNCREGFAATGEVRLPGAKIGGRLDCSGGTFTNENGPALSADGLTVDGSMFCREGFAARGEVWLLGAKIGGQLSCRGATFTNEGGRALSADGLTVDADMVCREGFAATGEVRLLGAKIGGRLDCSGGTFTNENGPALSADGLTVEGGMYCRDGFAARGEVRLPGARIGGQLSCSGGTFTNENGPALRADGLTVDRDMFCDEGFAATGEVRLSGAKIGGLLSCSGGTFTNENGPALRADGLTVARSLYLLPTMLSGSIDLTDAQVGNYVDDRRSWPEELRLGGFTYSWIEAIPMITIKERLEWVTRRASGFSPQPYEQLAAVYRRAGRDDDARLVAIEKQRQRRRHLKRWNVSGKAWHLLLDQTVGYGYRTWQAGLWLVGLLIVGSFIFHAAHDRHQLIAAHKGDAQPPFQPVIYTLDVILPVVNLHQRDAWIAHGPVQWLALTFTLTGWVLTTAVVLSLTGILKRE
jgi:hypothetical protein